MWRHWQGYSSKFEMKTNHICIYIVSSVLKKYFSIFKCAQTLLKCIAVWMNVGFLLLIKRSLVLLIYFSTLKHMTEVIFRIVQMNILKSKHYTFQNLRQPSQIIKKYYTLSWSIILDVHTFSDIFGSKKCLRTWMTSFKMNSTKYNKAILQIKTIPCKWDV